MEDKNSLEWNIRILFVSLIIATYSLFNSLDNMFNGFQFFDLLMFLIPLSLLEIYWIFSDTLMKDKVFSVLRISSYSAAMSYYTGGNIISLSFSLLSYALAFYVAFKLEKTEHERLAKKQ
jgi:hypothetical protein